MTPRRRLRFALDQNFPDPLLATLAEILPFVELVPIRAIDATFARLDDWELFVALHRAGTWDGLITNDDSVLALPKEMTILSQTALSLVVAKGEGDSPVRAVGALLCHLHHICHQSQSDRAQIWLLRVKQKNHETPREFLERIAERERTTVEALLRVHRLPTQDLVRATTVKR